METTKRLFTKILFGIVLGILLTSFLNVGISLFYPQPEWSDFCDEFPATMPLEGKETESRIAEERKCNEEYRKASDFYGRVVFFILAPIGLILLIAGTFMPNLTIQITMMGSGFINVIIGVLRNINDKLSVFVTIGILIVIGILFTTKKLRD